MYMCGWDVHMCADSCTCSDGITLPSPTLCSEVSLVWALLKSKQTHDKAMVNEGQTECGGFRSLRRELYSSDQSSLRESETVSYDETIGVEKGRKNQASGWVPLKRGPQYSRPIHNTAAEGRHKSSRKGWAEMQTWQLVKLCEVNNSSKAKGLGTEMSRVTVTIIF